MAIILNGEEMREESAQFKMFQSFCNLSFGCHLVTLKQYCFRLEMPDPGLRWLFFGRNAELRSKDPLERRSFGPRRKRVGKKYDNTVYNFALFTIDCVYLQIHFVYLQFAKT